MKKIFKIIILLLFFITIIAASAAFISSNNIAVLEPAGWIGEKEKDLIITASLLMLIVVIPVFIMTFLFAWKYREHKGSKHSPEWEHSAIAEYCWWGIPFIIICCLATITWKSSYDLSPLKDLKSNQKPLVIQVVALQWKWLFLYPEEKIATVNYIQFPVNRPIKFEITADAPMNSFWIPQLGGQIYAMPAMRSELRLIANKTGIFKGVSSNLSGTGFAGMTFKARASTSDEYITWINGIKNSEKSFGMKDYNLLVKPSENESVKIYNLEKNDLFDAILMKYMMPSN